MTSALSQRASYLSLSRGLTTPGVPISPPALSPTRPPHSASPPSMSDSPSTARASPLPPPLRLSFKKVVFHGVKSRRHPAQFPPGR